MERDTDYIQLKQSYRDQLVQVGVPALRAEQLAKVVTAEELRLVAGVWAEQTALFFQLERAILELRSS